MGHDVLTTRALMGKPLFTTCFFPFSGVFLTFTAPVDVALPVHLVTPASDCADITVLYSYRTDSHEMVREFWDLSSGDFRCQHHVQM